MKFKCARGAAGVSSVCSSQPGDSRKKGVALRGGADYENYGGVMIPHETG